MLCLRVLSAAFDAKITYTVYKARRINSDGVKSASDAITAARDVQRRLMEFMKDVLD